MARIPLVVILAGPNGAGKSTSASRLLQGALAVHEFVNADTIAGGLSAYRPEAVAVTAGRVMLARLHELAASRVDFAFETTLSGRGHSVWLRELRGSGYRVHMTFLSLPDADAAVARVAERVRRGGHSVPEDVIRRRYRAGLRNFFGVYRDTVDSWQLYDSALLDGPRLIASGSAGQRASILDHEAWARMEQQ
jgi:predicted ABC-type ATPase